MQGPAVFAAGSLLQLHSHWTLAQLRSKAVSGTASQQPGAAKAAAEATEAYLLPMGAPASLSQPDVAESQCSIIF